MPGEASEISSVIYASDACLYSIQEVSGGVMEAEVRTYLNNPPAGIPVGSTQYEIFG